MSTPPLPGTNPIERELDGLGERCQRLGQLAADEALAESEEILAALEAQLEKLRLR